MSRPPHSTLDRGVSLAEELSTKFCHGNLSSSIVGESLVIGLYEDIPIPTTSITLARVTSRLQSPRECSTPQSSKGQVIPSWRLGVMGYDMFSLLWISGRHMRHNELPHGKVIGTRSGIEHREHCISRTIALASLKASKPGKESTLFSPEGTLSPIKTSGPRQSREAARLPVRLRDVRRVVCPCRWSYQLGLIVRRRRFYGLHVMIESPAGVLVFRITVKDESVR